MTCILLPIKENTEVHVWDLDSLCTRNSQIMYEICELENKEKWSTVDSMSINQMFEIPTQLAIRNQRYGCASTINWCSHLLSSHKEMLQLTLYAFPLADNMHHIRGCKGIGFGSIYHLSYSYLLRIFGFESEYRYCRICKIDICICLSDIRYILDISGSNMDTNRICENWMRLRIT